jgi:c-Jun-amino-terminal kinase-interacting protein 4
MLYVHSSISRWRDCLHSVRLPDAILAIVHVESRTVVALANGKLAIFRRQTNGEWDLNSYHLLTLGEFVFCLYKSGWSVRSTQSYCLGSMKQSVRCLTIVGDKVWAAHRNKIYIVDPITLNIVHTLEAHPRKESQIRQMTATGLGVWVSIR